MTTTDTRGRILDTAERLFATRGFAATSLRAITTEAGVNVAAVNYHFGSKEELIHAVFARRLEPVNAERLRLLDSCEHDAERRGRTPPLAAVLRALVGPPLRLSDDPGGKVVMRLLARAHSEPENRTLEIFTRQFTEIARRFVAALHIALPRLPEEEVFWRLHFAVGIMAHTMNDLQRLKLFSRGRCADPDIDHTITRVVRFLVAGFRSPAPSSGFAAQKGAHR